MSTTRRTSCASARATSHGLFVADDRKGDKQFRRRDGWRWATDQLDSAQLHTMLLVVCSLYFSVMTLFTLPPTTPPLPIHFHPLPSLAYIPPPLIFSSPA